MKKKQLFMLITAILLLCIAATMVFYSSFIVRDIYVIPTDINISKKMGFNLDRDALHFGGVHPGGSSSRTMDIANKFNFPVKVSIKISGDFTEWIQLPENNFVMEAGEFKTVSAVVYVPLNTEIGNSHKGELKLIFTRVL